VLAKALESVTGPTEPKLWKWGGPFDLIARYPVARRAKKMTRIWFGRSLIAWLVLLALP
jgi:hypothetical protein